MKNLWNDSEAKDFLNDPLKLRVYTSQLLGQESNLVLHGGGNTSVKATVKNLFGEEEDILYVKGSGWDLATIASAGFAPVKMDVLLKMAEIENLSDTDMVKNQRAAMIDPNAPNPSVEAILHAIIPFKFVDHTHADAVVTITNTEGGEQKIKDIYGDRVLVVPYVMPGFILARTVYEMTRDCDWSKIEGMILLNHGVFTFADDGKKSYDQMIKLVSEAEDYLIKQKAVLEPTEETPKEDLVALAMIRQAVSNLRGRAVLAKLNNAPKHVHFSNSSHLESMATQGPLTPDHVIRTKRIPILVSDHIDQDVEQFKNDYQKYFIEHQNADQTMLDPAPRWGVWPGFGTLSFGSIKEVLVTSDIIDHTIGAIQMAEQLGGWKALPAKDIFDVEYWELEQAKLKKAGNPPTLQGKVALVTGAASGIGRACVETLCEHGAVIVAVDINPRVEALFQKPQIQGVICDVTKQDELQEAVKTAIRQFGGLDILVSNAGIFPAGEHLEDMNQDMWERSLSLNLSSHQQLLKECIPYLSLGVDPSVVIIASKNVPAPGPGAGAYSVAKAGLTQLARVAALELGAKGINVNIVHPNQVFDTAIWTKDVLESRAKHYNISVEEYKKSNLLKTEITSKDVSNLVCAMAGPLFSKTTGAQVPIDGGNDRVI